jgi:hypothetical protein
MRISKPPFLAFLFVAIAISPACAQTWVKNKVGAGADTLGSIVTAADHNWLLLGSTAGATNIYDSTNWGQTWTPGAVPEAETALEAASADGTHLVAVGSGTLS